MRKEKETAARMLRAFKGEHYTFGLDCFDRLGAIAARRGRSAAVIASGFGKSWGTALHDRIATSLRDAGVRISGDLIPGVRPNSPTDDVLRIACELQARPHDLVVTVGGGSVVDGAKASVVCAALGADFERLDSFFGIGKVTKMLKQEGETLHPLMAVQLASGSAAHLTKYSNVTDLATSQKKLIIDEAVIPPEALFDYGTTTTMSRGFTSDGALDGVAHALEVFYGSRGDLRERVRPVSLLAIRLIVNSAGDACRNPSDLSAREALGLGTDLGGLAIMIGGTNGAHLTSFSLVDVMSHGRACALMNPYYTVFFAPAIEPQLREVAAILAEAGYLKSNAGPLRGRDLGMTVAEGLIGLSTALGFPTTLAQVEGFTDEHMARALQAAKNPQLASKLANMPVPLSAATVDEYMGPILQAAKTGDFSLIRNMKDSGS